MDQSSTGLSAEDEAYLSGILNGQTSALIAPSMEQRLLESGVLVRTGGGLRPTALAMDLFRRTPKHGGQVAPMPPTAECG